MAPRREEVFIEIDAWLKDAAPSADLRRWFHHDPARWDEFRRRYLAELRHHPPSWLPALEAERRGTVTLLYSSHDCEHNNNAVGWKEFLMQSLSTEKLSDL